MTGNGILIRWNKISGNWISRGYCESGCNREWELKILDLGKFSSIFKNYIFCCILCSSSGILISQKSDHVILSHRPQVFCTCVPHCFSLYCAYRYCAFCKSKFYGGPCIEDVYFANSFFLTLRSLCHILVILTLKLFMVIIFLTVICDLESLMLLLQQDYILLKAQILISIFDQLSMFLIKECTLFFYT